MSVPLLFQVKRIKYMRTSSANPSTAPSRQGSRIGSPTLKGLPSLSSLPSLFSSNQEATPTSAARPPSALRRRSSHTFNEEKQRERDRVREMMKTQKQDPVARLKLLVVSPAVCNKTFFF